MPKPMGKSKRAGPRKLVPGTGKDERGMVCSLESVKGNLPRTLRLCLRQNSFEYVNLRRGRNVQRSK